MALTKVPMAVHVIAMSLYVVQVVTKNVGFASEPKRSAVYTMMLSGMPIGNAQI